MRSFYLVKMLCLSHQGIEVTYGYNSQTSSLLLALCSQCYLTELRIKIEEVFYRHLLLLVLKYLVILHVTILETSILNQSWTKCPLRDIKTIKCFITI